MKQFKVLSDEEMRREVEGILEPTLDRLYHQDLPDGKYAEIAIKASVGMLKSNLTTRILEYLTSEIIEQVLEMLDGILAILTTTGELRCWLCDNQFTVEVRDGKVNTVQCMDCGTYRCPKCNKCFCDLNKQAKRVVNIEWEILRKKVKAIQTIKQAIEEANND